MASGQRRRERLVLLVAGLALVALTAGFALAVRAPDVPSGDLAPGGLASGTTPGPAPPDASTTAAAEQPRASPDRSRADAAVIVETPAPRPDEGRRRPALLVVGDPSLNRAEQDVIAALRRAGFGVEVVDDSDASPEHADGKDLVVISKTIESVEVADAFKTARAGVIFWEDNAQAIETRGEDGVPGTGTPMLATITLVNPSGTAWHETGTHVHLNPATPSELRAGLTGRVPFYTGPAELTFAPTQDGATSLPASATWVAEFATPGDGRYVYYVIDADDGLADGTASHGRRVFFGLYDESFSELAREGLQLFDAAVAWAAGG